MNYFTQNRGFKLVTIILLALNLAVLITVIYRISPIYKPLSCIQKKQASPREFLIQELNLTPDQANKFDKLRIDFAETRKDIKSNMNKQRELILEELTKSNPDTAYLQNLAAQYGEFHAKLKLATIKHLLAFKKICTPEQEQKLYFMFNDMLSKDTKSKQEHHRMHGPPHNAGPTEKKEK